MPKYFFGAKFLLVHVVSHLLMKFRLVFESTDTAAHRYICSSRVSMFDETWEWGGGGKWKRKFKSSDYSGYNRFTASSRVQGQGLGCGMSGGWIGLATKIKSLVYSGSWGKDKRREKKPLLRTNRLRTWANSIWVCAANESDKLRVYFNLI